MKLMRGIAARLAATTLVGWYLIVPPFPFFDPQRNVDTHAPLNRWFALSRYHTKSECNINLLKLKTKRQKEIDKFANDILTMSNERFLYEEAVTSQDFSAQCIAGDDPRLKSDH